MDIRILQLIEGAREARGLTVIIDVFRAFSTECYAFNNGARRILPVGELGTAYALKKENPSFVLMGSAGTEAADEDTLCAQYIRDLLEGRPADFEHIRHDLQNSLAGRKFFDDSVAWAPRRDFDLCLDLGRFDIVLWACREEGRPLELRRVDVG